MNRNNFRIILRHTKRDISRQIGLLVSQSEWVQEGNLPDFICIGAARSGTTWLHQILTMNPEFYLPRQKEIHFFDEKKGYEKDHLLNLEWEPIFFFDLDKPVHWKWYSLQFRKGTASIKGDITPDYATISTTQILKIHNKLPKLKIVLLIRNPMERAWSQLRQSIWYQKGIGVGSVGLSILKKLVVHPAILNKGLYSDTMDRWESVFPKNQLYYVFYDDITKNPIHAVNNISNFIGADITVKQKKCIDSNIRVNSTPDTILPDDIGSLLTTIYKDEINRLENRFNRNLDAWQK